MHPLYILNHNHLLSCTIKIQGHFYSLCGSLRQTAVHCYLDQAPLSSLIPTTPPLLSQSPGSLGPSRGALVMGSSGNPNPHYRPHYSMLHNGDLFLAFTPSPDKTRTQTHTHRHTHILECTSWPRPSLSFFLQALSLSLSGPRPWWSGVLQVFVCSFVLEYKGRLSPSTSLFFCCCFFLIHPLHSPFLSSLSFLMS